MALKVEQIAVGDLLFDPSNVRSHSQRNLDAIKGSLTRFGQQKPIIVDKDNVVRAGNGTLAAVRELGWETITVVRSELLGAEMTAFAIADNRTAELAEWDYSQLGAVLGALADEEESCDVATGFTVAEIQALVPHQSSGSEEDGDGSLSDNLADVLPDATNVCPKCGFRF